MLRKQKARNNKMKSNIAKGLKKLVVTSFTTYEVHRRSLHHNKTYFILLSIKEHLFGDSTKGRCTEFSFFLLKRPVKQFFAKHKTIINTFPTLTLLKQ